jgi:hypothetical protein
MTTSTPETILCPYNFCHGAELGNFDGLALSAMAKDYMFPAF